MIQVLGSRGAILLWGMLYSFTTQTGQEQQRCPHASAVRVECELHSSHVRVRIDVCTSLRTLRVPLAHLTKRFTVLREVNYI